MDFHLVLHDEYLWPINYKNEFIYVKRDIQVLGEHPELIQHFDDTCLIFCQFLTIVFIKSQPIWLRIAKGQFMDWVDTILANTNMQTIFHETLISKFSKKSSEIHENVEFCLQFLYMFLCLSTYDTAYKICLTWPL